MFRIAFKTNSTKADHGMIRMNVVRLSLLAALSLLISASVAHADELFKLSNNQRIACSRGLAAGKLNTATCKSYTYVFNTRTSD
jgi:hypothetical protein